MRAEERQVLFVANNLRNHDIVDSVLRYRNCPACKAGLLFGCAVELTRPLRAIFFSASEKRGLSGKVPIRASGSNGALGLATCMNPHGSEFAARLANPSGKLGVELCAHTLTREKCSASRPSIYCLGVTIVPQDTTKHHVPPE